MLTVFTEPVVVVVAVVLDVCCKYQPMNITEALIPSAPMTIETAMSQKVRKGKSPSKIVFMGAPLPVAHYTRKWWGSQCRRLCRGFSNSEYFEGKLIEED